MFQLLIVFIFVNSLPCIYGPLHERTASVASQNELQTIEKHENMQFTNHIDITSERIDSATFPTKKQIHGTTSQTLEGCFKGLGRWLSRTRSKKKSPSQKQKCYQECYKDLSKKKAAGLPDKKVVEFGKCCSRIKAGDCEGFADEGSVGGPPKMIDNTAEDTQMTSMRLTNVPTEAERGTVPGLGRDMVPGSVQNDGARGGRRLKGGRGGTSKYISREPEPPCCCETCFEPCFVSTIGMCILCIDQSVRCCCRNLCDCLGKICDC